MCFIALDIGKEVKFAAVTDYNGKQCKNDNYYINNSLAKNRLLQTATSTSSVKENHRDNLNSSTAVIDSRSFLGRARILTFLI